MLAPLSRVLRRLPALFAAAAYLAAAVGGTGLHGLTGGHGHCDHGHAATCCGHDERRDDGPSLCSHGHAPHGHGRAGESHGAADGPKRCGGERRAPDGGKPDRGEENPPIHDPHHCAVCQFLAMGQQVAEAPRPVDAAGAAPQSVVEVEPSVGCDPVPAERGRGPPAAV